MKSEASLSWLLMPSFPAEFRWSRSCEIHREVIEEDGAGGRSQAGIDRHATRALRHRHLLLNLRPVIGARCQVWVHLVPDEPGTLHIVSRPITEVREDLNAFTRLAWLYVAGLGVEVDVHLGSRG